jgi:hypothetical protein
MPRYTQADLDRINRRIAQPQTVQDGDQRITDHGMEALLKLKAAIEADLAAQAGTPRSRVTFASFRRD